jgi:cell division protein ZapA (FtsZ GTPase activity inhibitor)
VANYDETDREETVRVEIYDRVYHVRSPEDEKYTRRIAKSVDAAMRSVAEQTHTADSLGVAVLTALHYADRYERLRQRYDRLNRLVTEKSENIRKALEVAGNTKVG